MIKIVCAGILSLFLAACHNGTEGVAGTYGVEEHGKVNPLVKVESAGDTYSLSEFRAGKWVPVKGVVKPFYAEGSRDADQAQGGRAGRWYPNQLFRPDPGTEGMDRWAFHDQDGLFRDPDVFPR
ncbi:hypothetical protein KEH59_41945 (plasmid) [Burkholderia contaminans]|uniref:hypothetical protein n=1 Tax=Burkholderia contaminans TaxID=488447 RepID=UPI001BA58BEE|nr:hypothetical protein [Burkholderia contaminans]QUN52931.1 hypothetical protein KEH59_41945 [Burkholderia contaminans]